MVDISRELESGGAGRADAGGAAEAVTSLLNARGVFFLIGLRIPKLWYEQFAGCEARSAES